MTRSTCALVAMLTLAPALAGCSGFRPFWQSDPAPHRAAERSIEGPLALARLAEQRGKTLEAERLYRSLLERSPDNAVIHHRLAIIEARKARFEDANAYFDRALRLKPDDPTLLSDAGYCQYLQHRLDVAESLFRQALDIDPHHEAATNNLALVLAEKGDDRAAFALFRQTGTEARAHANMGYMYTRRGELENAKAAYSRALSLDPQMIPAAEAMVQLAQFERQGRAAMAQARSPAARRSGNHAPVDHEAVAARPSGPRWPEPSSGSPEPPQAPWETSQAWPEPAQAPAGPVQVRPEPPPAPWETSQAWPEPAQAPLEDSQGPSQSAYVAPKASQAGLEPAEAPPEDSQVPSQSASERPEAWRAEQEPLQAASKTSPVVPEPAFVVPEPAYPAPGVSEASDKSESSASVGWAWVP